MPENRSVDEGGIPTYEYMSEPLPAAVTEEPRETGRSVLGVRLKCAVGASEGGLQAVQVPKECVFDVTECRVEDEVEGEDVEPGA